MKIRLIIVIAILFVSNKNYAQQFDGNELGVDAIFSASNIGGTAGMGLKYGFNYGESIIFGPCARFQRSWNKNQVTGTQGGFNVFGGGGFIHARFYNAFFLGAELEILKSPFTTFGAYSLTESNWVPTLFLGGGFSMEFNESWRLNIGVMYDVINKPNSPFRNSYFMKKTTDTGATAGYLPVIYRIALFFPLNRE